MKNFFYLVGFIIASQSLAQAQEIIDCTATSVIGDFDTAPPFVPKVGSILSLDPKNPKFILNQSGYIQFWNSWIVLDTSSIQLSEFSTTDGDGFRIQMNELKSARSIHIDVLRPKGAGTSLAWLSDGDHLGEKLYISRMNLTCRNRAANLGKLHADKPLASL